MICVEQSGDCTACESGKYGNGQTAVEQKERMDASIGWTGCTAVPSAHEDGSRVKTVKENAIGAKWTLSTQFCGFNLCQVQGLPLGSLCTCASHV